MAPGTDKVHRPSHYTFGKIEVLDFIKQVCEHYPGDEAFFIGNILKYISRAPHKGTKEEDIRKAQDYLGKLIEHRARKDREKFLADFSTSLGNMRPQRAEEAATANQKES